MHSMGFGAKFMYVENIISQSSCNDVLLTAHYSTWYKVTAFLLITWFSWRHYRNKISKKAEQITMTNAHDEISLYADDMSVYIGFKIIASSWFIWEINSFILDIWIDMIHLALSY